MHRRFKYKHNKKGSFLDFFLLPVLLFICAVFLVVSFMVIHKVNSSGIFSTDADAQKAINAGENSLLNMDNMMLFILVGLSLFTIISAYFAVNHPAFFIIGVILLAIAITISAIISNAYETLSTNSNINDTSARFGKTGYLMANLPLFLCFIGFLTAIAMYVGYNRNG